MNAVIIQMLLRFIKSKMISVLAEIHPIRLRIGLTCFGKTNVTRHHENDLSKNVNICKLKTFHISAKTDNSFRFSGPRPSPGY